MAEWQTMESAPKDGTRVLMHRDGYAETVAVGFWSVRGKDWVTVPGMWSWYPTKWVPLLPDPPKSEASK